MFYYVKRVYGYTIVLGRYVFATSLYGCNMSMVTYLILSLSSRGIAEKYRDISVLPHTAHFADVSVGVVADITLVIM